MNMADMLPAHAVASSRTDLSRSVWYSGHLLTFLVSAEETGGAYSIIEELSRREASADPPPHMHTRESETFYVIEGRVHFWVGDQFIEAGPGSVVSLPPHVPHRFAIASEQVRMLNMLVPGAFEGFFRELSVPAGALTLPPPSDEPVDVPRILETGVRYGIEFLPPRE